MLRCIIWPPFRTPAMLRQGHKHLEAPEVPNRAQGLAARQGELPMKIAKECVVSIHYTLTDDRGEELDTSRGAAPLTYIHGTQGLIPGLERALEGREAGDGFQASIQPEDAYGEINPALIQDVPLDVLSGIEDLKVGMRLQSRAPDGQMQMLIVDAIGAESATLNANHLLAGEVLHFDVAVEHVREATAEELEQGLQG